MVRKMYVISFEATHYAMQIENLLKNDFKVEMIPTPREISSSCGLSLKISADDLEDIIIKLKQSSLDYKMFKIFFIDRDLKNDIIQEVSY